MEQRGGWPRNYDYHHRSDDARNGLQQSDDATALLVGVLDGNTMIAVFDPDHERVRAICGALWRSPVVGHPLRVSSSYLTDALDAIREHKPGIVICSTEFPLVFSAAKHATNGRVRLIALTDETGKIPRNQKVDHSFLRDPLPVEAIAEACAA